MLIVLDWRVENKLNGVWENTMNFKRGGIASMAISVAMSACGSNNSASHASGDEADGQIEASLTQIPSGVMCVQITSSRGQMTSLVSVSAGQSSTTITIGRLIPGTTTLQAAAFNIACSSVTSSTSPDWVGSPVTVNVQPGINPQVVLTLLPNVDAAVAVNFLQPASAISAGYFFSFALAPNGTVRAWGDNVFEELGDGTTAPLRLAPVAATLVGQVVGIQGGSTHACAVTPAGALNCWGGNSIGQLGDGTTTNRTNPVQVIASGVVKVATGSDHTCVLKNDGSVWCTGASGAFGNGTNPQLTFIQMIAGSTIDLSAGGGFTCEVGVNGNVGCSGGNANGQCGTGTAGGVISGFPTVVGSSSFFSKVRTSAGGSFACGLKSNGSVWCWGANGSGQLGDGTTVDRAAPVQVVGLSGAVQIALGNAHACARLTDGTVQCWGANNFGQLGDGSGAQQVGLVNALGLSGTIDLTAGIEHTCSLLASGDVQCWGHNMEGQVGTNSVQNQFVPAPVAW